MLPVLLSVLLIFVLFQFQYDILRLDPLGTNSVSKGFAKQHANSSRTVGLATYSIPGRLGAAPFCCYSFAGFIREF